MSSSATAPHAPAPASGLPPRYEIRKLGPEHLEWCSAITLHANLFHTEKWSPLFKGERAKRCLHAFKISKRALLHSLECGLSYGIFDKEYEYKREGAREKGGAIYWDEFPSHEDLPPAFDDDGTKLLEAMDFPLVSVALAYDDFVPTPLEDWVGFATALSEITTLYAAMDKVRKQSEDERGVTRAAEPRFRMRRSGTATRRDYERRGLMKHLAHFEMCLAAELGFSQICLSTSNSAVKHVWTHPPRPFRGEVVLTLGMNDLEVVDKDGRKTQPYLKCGPEPSNSIVCYLR